MGHFAASHLSLARLDLAGAATSSRHTWPLIFSHMSALQHLDLSNCSKFTEASAAGLLHLRGLTSLDVQGTKAGDLAALSHLAKLSAGGWRCHCCQQSSSSSSRRRMGC